MLNIDMLENYPSEGRLLGHKSLSQEYSLSDWNITRKGKY
jgi:hypothetical protein